jgi:hypothetical protein
MAAGLSVVRQHRGLRQFGLQERRKKANNGDAMVEVPLLALCAARVCVLALTPAAARVPPLVY